jgi:hypothetical protein
MGGQEGSVTDTISWTHLDEAWFLAAISESPMVSTIAICTASKASARCFRDSLAQYEVGSLGSGFSEGLDSSFDVMNSSFSAVSGLSIGAESTLHLSIGTTSIPSSIGLIRHFPECSLVLFPSLLTENVVYMLGNGWMLLTDLRGSCMDTINGEGAIDGRKELLLDQPDAEWSNEG